ncbi:unnamed protein product [Thlaspi arvense]|uniref:Transmembrane protein n=1 Tax=Thlaspi arvense TaxID=13288 RepID=A0AAU9SBB7_THLAR|nr:unnamed protein product [Thlaspi arvense]
MGWLAKTRADLENPNPAIVIVFLVSNIVTFTSGIALAVEWLFHGKSHSGFGWIIYYALFLICLPPVILLALRVLMAISGSAAAKEPCADVHEAQRSEEETERNSCRSLAVVVDSDEMKKTPRIKRTVSFPSHGKARSCRTR